MKISASYAFAAAMRLPQYSGKCADYHGYDFKLTVSVQVSATGQSGFDMDLIELDRLVEERVIHRLDNGLLNEHMDCPSLENAVRWMADQLRFSVPGLDYIELAAGPRYKVGMSMSELAI